MSRSSLQRVDLARGFTDVDETAEPGRFLEYLDRVTALPEIQHYKQRTYELLRLKPGAAVLDTGCGAGDDARALAGLGSQVIGLDRSAFLIEEARRRTKPTGLAAEFREGDVEALEMGNEYFDACRSDRAFQHLADPRKALQELVRVAKPGAQVVVSEPDWGTLLVDGGPKKIARAVLDFYADRVRNGWIGRQLPRLFSEAGLSNVEVHVQVMQFRRLADAELVFGIQGAAVRAYEAGAISLAQAAEWIDRLRESEHVGCFFCAVTGVAASGTK